MDLGEERKRLPIFSIRSKLIGEIQRNPTIILLGETGCGKTTQIPQYIHEFQPNMKGMIGCTQPRRVAAITVAQRVAQETRTELGKLVGYCVRFEDVTSAADTKIKYMTDGMLLREAIGDPLLARYTMIILDEVHERTIHTDVLMGIVKKAQQLRSAAYQQQAAHKNSKEATNGGKPHHHFLKPLKIILMSATMDVDEFSKYFNNAPVLYLEGRLFNVDVFHTAQEQTDYTFSTISTVFQIHKSKPFSEDILVFMTGQEEIESTCKTLRELNNKNASLGNKRNGANGTAGANSVNAPMLVLPLYAALPSGKQLRVFEKAPAGHRKIIISTNIAETSITIKGVKYVIDTGMIKGKLYTPQNNLEMLKVHKISKSQAWQRTGRAGREAPGVCYRLYTENEYESMPLNTVPEILRSNLLSVALQLIALGIQDILSFDFMSKPSKESLQTALDQLELLGAIKKAPNENEAVQSGENGLASKKRKLENGAAERLTNEGSAKGVVYELTPVGKKMAQFPLDPKLSRCILAADKLKCVEEVIKILSVLSVETVFHNQVATSNSKREQAQMIKQKYHSADGDHITLLNVYKAFVANKQNKEWCNENMVDFKNLKLAVDICRQLRDICARNNIAISSSTNNTVSIRQAIIEGFFMNAAEYTKENEYKTITSRQLVQIHPSSVLFNSKPSCVIFNELVKTNKTYMRDISVISSNWLLESHPTYFKSKLRSTDN